MKNAALPPDCLVLEIAEQVFAENQGFTIRACQQLRDIGVRIALVNFGIGGAPLVALRQFPVDFLKIDRFFLDLLKQAPTNDRMVEAVIHLGQALRLPVMAEGIGSFDQVVWLRDHGCDYGQGPYFGRYVEADLVPELLSSNRPWLRSLYRPSSS